MELVRNSINKTNITALANRIKLKYDIFQKQEFLTQTLKNFNTLGLNERIERVTNSLATYLPNDFSISANILINSLVPVNENNSLDGTDITSDNGFIIVALSMYVAKYGQNHFAISMKALYEFTRRFSSESAIRYFLISNEKKTFQYFDKWVRDKNIHPRRLVSEGLRPRLPWAIQLKQYIKNPKPVLKYLEILKNDPELYVRRSVANNLNDISKDNPEVVIKILKKWNKKPDKNMDWLSRHALRTLIKQGNPEALALLGYYPNPDIEIINLSIKELKIMIGESLKFSFQVKSMSDSIQKLMIDYIIYHVKANGKTTPKVFKLTKKTINPGQSIYIKKSHAFKIISTRKYYPGTHKILLQINGKNYGDSGFELLLS